jgi:hypothetical protein
MDGDYGEPRTTYREPVQQPFRPARKKGSGALIFFLGFASLTLGLYSWFLPIPFFSSTFSGEILGAIATIIGLFSLSREATNPADVGIMTLGLGAWIAGWLSNIVYIPVLSDSFLAEFAGIGLILFGYLRTRSM